MLCPPHGLSWPSQVFLGLSPLWGCPHIGDQPLLLPVKPALSCQESSQLQLQVDLHQGRIQPLSGAEGGRDTGVRDPESTNIPVTSCLKPS